MTKEFSTEVRIEKDSLGEVRVPVDALWQAQTQRAVDNFNISEAKMPPLFISALGIIKQGCALANNESKNLDDRRCNAIVKAASEVAQGKWNDHFPVDVYQTGSGTSSNMNANEVIATLANRYLKDSDSDPIHPNDHVNMGQSSNDVVPTAMHIAAAIALKTQLHPALDHLIKAIEQKAAELSDVVKTGRTHLMDAMPLTFGQELGAWAAALSQSKANLAQAENRILALALGGTAIGSGINSSLKLSRLAVKKISELTAIDFRQNDNLFAGLSTVDGPVQLSSSLKSVAVNLTKIANDLRWMNSGPLAGLGEIELQALQPGSSIMPGKVNPVIPEAVAQASAQVIGNDAAVTLGGTSGAFQLNVMLPMVATTLLNSIHLMSTSCQHLADKAIATFKVRHDQIMRPLGRNPILVTALNSVIGYSAAADIAKKAYKEDRGVIDVAEEMTDLSREELTKLLDPSKLTGPFE